MSSHYFVREGQEPAIIILDRVPYSLVSDLLAWAPAVVVSSYALESVLTWGIKIDTVIVIEERVNPEDPALAAQHPFTTIAADDVLDGLSKSFSHLKMHGNSAVVVVVQDAPIFIQSLADTTPPVNLAIMDEKGRWVNVTNQYTKWVPAGTLFAVFPENKAVVSTNGLSDNGSSFVALTDGVVRLSADGDFWVGEFYDKPLKNR